MITERFDETNNTKESDNTYCDRDVSGYRSLLIYAGKLHCY